MAGLPKEVQAHIQRISEDIAALHARVAALEQAKAEQDDAIRRKQRYGIHTDSVRRL